MRTCVICGININGRDKQSITCSTKCRIRVIYARRREHRAQNKARAPAKPCHNCGNPIIGRAGNARFCSHNCCLVNNDDRSKAARIKAKPVRNCRWCKALITASRDGRAVYCCDDCRYQAGKKRDREKIARYRSAEPARSQDSRKRENEQRLQARLALKLIRQIENNGLEALL